MKKMITALSIIAMMGCNSTTQRNEGDMSVVRDSSTQGMASESNTSATYRIIVKADQIPGVIDTAVIAKLSEPLRAAAAFYAAMGGTMCDGETCQLTTALGLGKQGSDEHKNLIKKYFSNDKVAAAVIKQDCYLRPSGATTFTDYEYLSLSQSADTLKVDYRLMHYNRGKEQTISGPDIYIVQDDNFKKIQRHLWTHIE